MSTLFLFTVFVIVASFVMRGIIAGSFLIAPFVIDGIAGSFGLAWVAVIMIGVLMWLH